MGEKWLRLDLLVLFFIAFIFIFDIHSLFVQLTAGTGREKEIRFKFEEGLTA